MNPIRSFATLFPLLALSAAASAQAGASLFVAHTGHVIATYLGNSASYSNDLYLGSTFIFNNHASAIGSVVDLGSFSAGTELVFRLHVNDTGNDFYTGDASRNPDDHAHAFVTFGTSSTQVDFEDLYNGPFNYNDLSFSFTNVASVSSVPGPMAALPFALLALRRRRKA